MREAGRTKLAIAGLRSGYGATDVIAGISLEIPAGEICALMGKNGMGKTTLLKSVMGLLPLREGRVGLDGEDITGWTPARLLARGLGYAPQELPLFQDLTIHDNLRLALRDDRALAPALERVFGYFPFLAERLNQKAGTLSGGEQKMLILSRSLMLQPDLLLVDEISEGVQPSVVQRIARALLGECERRGMTVLLVEQNLGFALSVAHRWAVLKLGHIQESGENDAAAHARIMEHLKI